MSKNPASDDSSRVWGQIDGTNISVIGKRVFYNHPRWGKCLAFVIGVTGYGSAQGQLQDRLVVFLNDGSGMEFPFAALSDDRTPGTYALANDGDLTDNPNTPKPEASPAVEEPVESDAQPAQNQSEATYDPADTNKDGFVSNKERKQQKRQ